MKRMIIFLILISGCFLFVSCRENGNTGSSTSELTEKEREDTSDPIPESGKETSSETVPERQTEPETNAVTEPETGIVTEPETTVSEPEATYSVSCVGHSPGTGILYRNNGKNGSILVCIDAGHQGNGMNETEPNAPGSSVMKAKVTSGTQGAFTGIPEHELNLRVALCLRDLLLEKGYSVLMVRETKDVTISNAERAVMANENGATLLIRIHANGASDAGVNGAMTMCQTAANPDNGFCYKEARKLSELVLSSFCEETGMKYLYVSETDTMTGINWCTVPAAIIEMGFMSNKEDDFRMAEESFPYSAAKGIAEGIARYFDE